MIEIRVVIHIREIMDTRYPMMFIIGKLRDARIPVSPISGNPMKGALTETRDIMKNEIVYIWTGIESDLLPERIKNELVDLFKRPRW